MANELATVKRVIDTGLAIALPDGTEGRVPLSEVFPDDVRPIVLRNLVYIHPVSIAVGQSIPVLPLADRPGCYSRKAAVCRAWESVSVGDETEVTISEITADWIFGISDPGFKVCLPLWETEARLRAEYGRPRLHPSRERGLLPDDEREQSWLYLRDRIKVRLGKKTAESLVAGELLTKGTAPTPAAAHTASVFALPPKAPSFLYDEALIIEDDLDEAESLQRYFRDGGYQTHWVVDLADLKKWLRARLEEFSEDETKRLSTVAVVAADSSEFDWQQSCDHLRREMSAVDVVLSVRSQESLTSGLQTAIRQGQSQFHVQGIWNKEFGLDALGSILTRQSAMTGQFDADDVAQANPGPQLTQRRPQEVVRYRSLAEDTRLVLRSLVKIAGPEVEPCTAILFRIHRRWHKVKTIAAVGDDRIRAGFRRYAEDLHKSPVRDLAIYGQPCDTDDARKHLGRYVYFLDAMGGIDSHLSVLGFRPTPPPGSAYAYALFLFSGKTGAFENHPLLSKTAQRGTCRTIEILLLADFLDNQAQQIRRMAERASDFQFMAHEAVGYLRGPAEIMQQTQPLKGLPAGDSETVRTGTLRAWAVMRELLPGQTLESSEFSPIELVENLFALCRQLSPHSGIDLRCDSDLARDEYLEGRRLAIECVLRNLILNAVQQLEEYCEGRGTVCVSIRLEREPSGQAWLVATVMDDGPGIHARYWESIFLQGVSTRRNGTGLGLGISRRLITEAGGMLELVESLVYNGTSFRVSLPIGVVRRRHGA